MSRARMTSLPVLLVISLIAVNADAAPASILEVAVSAPVQMPAGAHQTNPRAASNGDVTLVVWRDDRTGTTASFAARLAADGTPLDPLGIPLPGVAVDVLWTGETFAVVVYNTSNAYSLVYVDADGSVREVRPMYVPESFQYACARSGGGNGRFLFSRDASAVVIDGAGYFRGGLSVNELLAEGEYPNWIVAADSPRGFMALLRARNLDEETVYAVGIDENGGLLSFADAKLPVWDERSLLESGDEDFILLSRPFLSDHTVTYRLDADGVHTGQSMPFRPPSTPGAFENVPSAIEWNGSRYLVASNVRGEAGHESLLLSEIPSDVSIGEDHVIREIVGFFLAATFVRDFTQPFLITNAFHLFTASGYDLFAQRISESLDVSAPEVIAFSATIQTNPNVTTSPSGYAITWSETGPDRFERRLVRRFTRAGAPIDPAPLELYRREATFNPQGPLQSSITAVGEVYAVIWHDRERASRVIRRLGAPGEWLDPSPVSLELRGEIAWSADGSGLRLLGQIDCPDSTSGQCLATQRVTFGEQLEAHASVRTAASVDPYNLSIACSGTECLLLWADGHGWRECPILCPYVPPILNAIRVRADGATLDAEPIEIDGEIHDVPAALIWSDDRYLLAWSDDFGSELRMASVSREGHLDTSGNTVVRRVQSGSSIADVQLIPSGDGVAVVTQILRRSPDGFNLYDARYEITTICTSCAIGPALPAPLFKLLEFHDARVTNGSADFASWGDELVAAYVRPGDHERTGSATRAFGRIFAPVTRRRSTRH